MMSDEIKDMRAQIKNNIVQLIDKKEYGKADQLFNQYIAIVQDDCEIYGVQATSLLTRDMIDDAKRLIETGLFVDKNNFDLLYQLGYIYEMEKSQELSWQFYLKAKDAASNHMQKKLVEKVLRRLQPITEISIDKNAVNKRKIAFFVKTGMDSFLGNIVVGLSSDYEVKKVVVTNFKQIEIEMLEADICWFEWCDELIIFASKLLLAKERKIICRLHSYEAFTDLPQQVDWNTVNTLICDVAHIRDVVIKNIDIDQNKIVLIPVGVDTEQFVFRERKRGFNIAYIGYINYKKGPMLLIHFIHALVQKDPRYKLHICGEFQDQRYILYFQQMIREMKLENNISYTGRVKDVNEWLEDKDYILSTSLLEGQHLTVMEGMCKGIKPIIHNFVGAKQVYNEQYVWNTLDEAVKMVRTASYKSEEYRKYIVDNYSNSRQLERINGVLRSFEEEKKSRDFLISQPLVTVAITNYNYKQHLKRAIQSVLDQTYDNIEIMIIDDCSTDGSIELIQKYEQKYPNVRSIVHKKNSGSAVLSIQESIQQACGEFLLYLSADDYLANPKVINEFLQELSSNLELDYVFGNLQIVNEVEEPTGVWTYQQYNINEVVKNTFVRGGSGVLPVTAGLYRMSFYRKNNLSWYDDKENRVAGDTLNSLIYIKNGFKYKYLDKNMICYRHHAKNMTYDIRSRVKSIISVLEYIIANFSEEIYFDEIPWKELKGNSYRQATKLYLITVHYMNLFRYYNTNEFKPWDGSSISVSDEEIKSYTEPLALKVKEYLDASLKTDSRYLTEIQSMKMEIEKIFGK
ncbi:glycosyltransferase [Propionispora vibrioides]|uniref:Glycosyltransferase involved in cell wall bisynthesis n=1 Tax=Propionispora vibrioides TaxID=112903 RepID=A0A1H8RWX7_9FIRM|nr:glycosyltransferase [Propionispora vibrioides]SEO70880.1 Glycosyltransferase involved in cell wall bisynthesis [Propionispora vibrioides]